MPTPAPQHFVAASPPHHSDRPAHVIPTSGRNLEGWGPTGPISLVRRLSLSLSLTPPAAEPLPNLALVALVAVTMVIRSLAAVVVSLTQKLSGFCKLSLEVRCKGLPDAVGRSFSTLFLDQIPWLGGCALVAMES